ncbi:polysaccharide deacetylase family protein [Massilia brevitalea]|uniref:polysaccharide deacetylase family protein n=1 Tax=Massilia brevitalea TaxID=442526 RepID=UPI00273974FF|nr:polysaccharide deacetylase family protein [Massilia brevitalea]
MKIKTLILHAAKYAGLFALMRATTRKNPRILCYHAGSIGDERHYNPKLFCTRAQLRQRLDWLKRRGFVAASLEQATQPGTGMAGIPVAVTIDDGWYSTYRDLLPSLAEYGYRPVLYLHSEASDAGTPIVPVTLRYLAWKAGAREVTLNGYDDNLDGIWDLADPRQRERLVGAAEKWVNAQPVQAVAGCLERFGASLGVRPAELDLASRRFSYMSEEELREASAHGCRIELHGHVHVYLPGQPHRNQENIERNRARIRAAGLPYPTHYCYPSGSYDSYAPDVMRAAGVATATTCVPGLVDVSDPDARYYLPRFLDGGDVSMIEFEAEMSGVLELLRSLTRRQHRPRRVLRPTTA